MHVVCNVAPIQSVTQFVGEEGKGERERQGKAAYSVRSPDHASLACVSLFLPLSRTALGTIDRSGLARYSPGVARVGWDISDVVVFVGRGGGGTIILDICARW